MMQISIKLSTTEDRWSLFYLKILDKERYAVQLRLSWAILLMGKNLSF